MTPHSHYLSGGLEDFLGCSNDHCPFAPLEQNARVLNNHRCTVPFLTLSSLLTGELACRRKRLTKIFILENGEVENTKVVPIVE